MICDLTMEMNRLADRPLSPILTEALKAASVHAEGEDTEKTISPEGELNSARILIVFPFIVDKKPFLNCWEE